MSTHIFYPSTELPSQAISYAAGLKNNAATVGQVTGNSEAELAPMVAAAQQLVPMADAIEKLQIELATKLDAYHKAATPLWAQFSEHLDYARTYAEKHDHKGLGQFLDGYKHHQGRHAAKKAADAVPAK